METKKQTETTETTETTDTKKQTKTTEKQGHNANIMKVWTEQGVEEAVKKMFVHPENGTRMSYSEMRSFYG
jgi:hypothetical protein